MEYRYFYTHAVNNQKVIEEHKEKVEFFNNLMYLLKLTFKEDSKLAFEETRGQLVGFTFNELIYQNF